MKAFPSQDIIMFNSLWLSDAIWWHWSESTLVQVMAWCHQAPSHYLNQCRLLISKVHWNSSQVNFTKKYLSHIAITFVWKASKFHSNLPGADELSTYDTLQRLTIIKDHKEWSKEITHALYIANFQMFPHIPEQKENMLIMTHVMRKHRNIFAFAITTRHWSVAGYIFLFFSQYGFICIKMDVVSVSLLLLHQNLQSSNELIKAILQLTCTWYFSVCPDSLVWSSCSCDHIAVHLYQCGAGLMPHSPVNPSEIKEQFFMILLTCRHSTNYSKNAGIL